MIRRLRPLVVLSMLFSFSQSGSSASVVLIPTLYNGGGAFSSQWRTLAVVNNLTAKPFGSPGVSFEIQCSSASCLSATVPAGAFASIAAPQPANGLLLYLPSDDAAITFAARIAALPRDRYTEGTELPIVQERSFTRGTLQFPYVPYGILRNPFRTTLRIYAIDATATTSVHVEMHSWNDPGGPPIASTTVTLETPSGGESPPIFPAFAQLTLQDRFPGQADALCNITVTPSPSTTSTARIWAFITITDNINQEVTIQTPQ